MKKKKISLFFTALCFSTSPLLVGNIEKYLSYAQEYMHYPHCKKHMDNMHEAILLFLKNSTTPYYKRQFVTTENELFYSKFIQLCFLEKAFVSVIESLQEEIQKKTQTLQYLLDCQFFIKTFLIDDLGDYLENIKNINHMSKILQEKEKSLFDIEVQYASLTKELSVIESSKNKEEEIKKEKNNHEKEEKYTDTENSKNISINSEDLGKEDKITTLKNKVDTFFFDIEKIKKDNLVLKEDIEKIEKNQKNSRLIKEMLVEFENKSKIIVLDVKKKNEEIKNINVLLLCIHKEYRNIEHILFEKSPHLKILLAQYTSVNISSEYQENDIEITIMDLLESNKNIMNQSQSKKKN